MKKNGSRKPKPNEVSVVVFSNANPNQPRAALFKSTEAAKARELAKKLNFEVIEVVSRELRSVAPRLSHGKLHLNGSEAVPLVTLPINGELRAAVTATRIAQGKTTPVVPQTWAAVKTGDLVIAQESRKDGWYEAVVLNRSVDMLHLKWLDYPADPIFMRHVKAVALTHPPAAA